MSEGDLDVVARLLEELHDPPTVVADPQVWRLMLAQPQRTILIAELDGEPAGNGGPHGVAEPHERSAAAGERRERGRGGLVPAPHRGPGGGFRRSWS